MKMRICCFNEKIVKIMACIMICTLSLHLLCACSNVRKNTDDSTDVLIDTNISNERTENTDNAISQGTSFVVDDTDKDLVNDGSKEIIETPYLNLTFEHAFVDYLSVEHHLGKPYVLKFYAILENRSSIQLFEIVFDDDINTDCQMINTPLGVVTYKVVFYPFSPNDDWSRNEIDTVLAMQEELNSIVERIEAYQVVIDQEDDCGTDSIPEFNASESVEIRTPYCVLNYPKEWETNLKVEAIEGEFYTLNFYCILDNEVQEMLFSFVFGGDEGEQLGVLKNGENKYVPVYLVLETIDSEIHRQEDADIYYEMQEAVNVLIAQMSLE